MKTNDIDVARMLKRSIEFKVVAIKKAKIRIAILKIGVWIILKSGIVKDFSINYIQGDVKK